MSSSLASLAVQNPMFHKAAKDAAFQAVKREEGDNDLFFSSAKTPIDPTQLDVSENELAQLKKWSRNLRISMLVIAGLLVYTSLASVFTITNDISTLFIALYLFFFAVLICAFECALKMCSAIVVENFGFLYNATGKTIFLTFVAVLAYQLSIIGKVVFGLLIAHGCVYIFVVYKHPKYPQYLRLMHFYSSVRAGKASMPAEVHDDNTV
jgi:hypothetical protein